jgi:hypothetical protein
MALAMSTPSSCQPSVGEDEAGGKDETGACTMIGCSEVKRLSDLRTKT